MMSMKSGRLLAVGSAFASLAALASCSSKAGAGAAAGAVGGAVVGGPIGAAVGAVGGAIVGSVVQESEAHRYGAAPTAGYPMAAATDRPGFYRSPYSGGIYDLRDVPHRALIRDDQTNQLFRKP
jgi:hypothetical protein